MKNVISNTKKRFLIVAMFTTLLSFANERSIFIIKNDAEKTSIYLENVKKGNLLSIKDNNGVVLYEERMEQNGIYNKGFDLTFLQNGLYVLELDKDSEINTMPFEIKYKEIIFYKNLERTSFKPIMRKDGDLVFISKFGLNNKPINIKVYHENESSNLLYEENITNTDIAERILKLEGLQSGSYKIVMLCDDREFIKYIDN